MQYLISRYHPARHATIRACFHTCMLRAMLLCAPRLPFPRPQLRRLLANGARSLATRAPGDARLQEPRHAAPQLQSVAALALVSATGTSPLEIVDWDKDAVNSVRLTGTVGMKSTSKMPNGDMSVRLRLAVNKPLKPGQSSADRKTAWCVPGLPASACNSTALCCRGEGNAQLAAGALQQGAKRIGVATNTQQGRTADSRVSRSQPSTGSMSSASRSWLSK